MREISNSLHIFINTIDRGSYQISEFLTLNIVKFVLQSTVLNKCKVLCLVLCIIYILAKYVKTNHTLRTFYE